VKSASAAVEQFGKACEASYPLGCLDAGRLYLEGGAGLEVDREVAAVHLDKACAASVAEACTLADTARTAPGPGVVGPQQKGCCDAGGDGPAGPLLLVLVVMLSVRGRTRRRARGTR
jgi:TPR repeat protein